MAAVNLFVVLWCWALLIRGPSLEAVSHCSVSTYGSPLGGTSDIFGRLSTCSVGWLAMAQNAAVKAWKFVAFCCEVIRHARSALFLIASRLRAQSSSFSGRHFITSFCLSIAHTASCTLAHRAGTPSSFSQVVCPHFSCGGRKQPHQFIEEKQFGPAFHASGRDVFLHCMISSSNFGFPSSPRLIVSFSLHLYGICFPSFRSSAWHSRRKTLRSAWGLTSPSSTDEEECLYRLRPRSCQRACHAQTLTSRASHVW